MSQSIMSFPQKKYNTVAVHLFRLLATSLSGKSCVQVIKEAEELHEPFSMELEQMGDLLTRSMGEQMARVLNYCYLLSFFIRKVSNS